MSHKGRVKLAAVPPSPPLATVGRWELARVLRPTPAATRLLARVLLELAHRELRERDDTAAAASKERQVDYL